MALGFLGKFFGSNSGLTEKETESVHQTPPPVASNNPQPEELTIGHGIANAQAAQFMQEDNSFSPAMTNPELILERLKAYDFPEIRNVGKVDNTNFIAVKRHYINLAYEAVQEYTSFVMHLTPIALKEEYAAHIEFIVKGFINFFWDMPSSKEHHDNQPFGHLTHSLEVACRQAYTMSLHNVTNERGIDSEQTKKQRPLLVMTGFVAGLLHDANKIFNYDLQCIMPGKMDAYSPMKGAASILDFCLKYPSRHIRKGWKTPDKVFFHYGIHILFNRPTESLGSFFRRNDGLYLFNSPIRQRDI